LAGAAWGQGIERTAGRYLYVQGEYIDGSEFELLGGDVDGDGYGADLSVPMTSNTFVYMHYDTVGSGSSDVDTFSGGIGGNITVSQGLDLYGIVSYEHIDATLGGGDADLDGYGVRLGARYFEIDQLELNAEVRYADYGRERGFGFADLGIDGSFLALGGAYSFTERLVLTAEFLAGEYELQVPGGTVDLDREDISLGVRWYIQP
jgi:hypothetical protein